MKRLFATDQNNWTSLIARLTLGIVVFPHGAQKLLGWFGGHGFTDTLNAMTNLMHLPWIVAFLVIIIESLGALAVLMGVGTRFVAAALFIVFIGIILHSHIDNGFFMNWRMMPDQPEGFEFHLLIVGLCIILILAGGGKWSVDGALHGDYARRPAGEL
ncbi:MAG: DoxX family protein [Chitinophagaceae bacterium]